MERQRQRNMEWEIENRKQVKKLTDAMSKRAEAERNVTRLRIKGQLIDRLIEAKDWEALDTLEINQKEKEERYTKSKAIEKTKK